MVLVIGGAGFIGSHTADELFKKGYGIRILDSLHPRVHFGRWPEWVKGEYEKIKGDARNARIMDRALKGVSHVVHVAALTDLVPDYKEFFDINVGSTALMYQIIRDRKLPIEKIVVASSQFVYGEGKWNCIRHGLVTPKARSFEKLDKGLWEPVCPKCEGKISFVKYVETHQDPGNHYAISKYTQELIALKLGRLNNIPSAAMRYSIVQGPRQSVKNMYSSALRIFAMAALKGDEITIYEDGLQTRDFVSVHDVAKANVLALENPKADYENYNVGAGKGYTVLELAKEVAKVTGYSKKVVPAGMYRVGDSRHSVSDISKIRKLGWKPKMTLKDTVNEYVGWMKTIRVNRDYLKMAKETMKKSGMVKMVTVLDH
jgi:dTDP-L-rhamnose 4-epimerase